MDYVLFNNTLLKFIGDTGLSNEVGGKLFHLFLHPFVKCETKSTGNLTLDFGRKCFRILSSKWNSNEFCIGDEYSFPKWSLLKGIDTSVILDGWPIRFTFPFDFCTSKDLKE